MLLQCNLILISQNSLLHVLNSHISVAHSVSIGLANKESKKEEYCNTVQRAVFSALIRDLISGVLPFL